jgi:hypothetical protein
MELPPRWKIKRELRRAKENVLDGLRFLPVVDRVRQLRYDLLSARLLRETQGALALTPRMAVFVLFQPKGLAASTFLTLEHLTEEKWSVLVVSNAPLTESDRSRVAMTSSYVIERPNAGYDFGAYREGWQWIHRHVGQIDRLILMNDSTWFPLRRQDDSLRRMEKLNVDLTGHIFKTELSDDPSHDHIEAHLLMFGPRALTNLAIKEFWAKYLMSDSRDVTIATGEKGITQTARDAGLVVKGLLDRERIIKILSSQADGALLDIASNVVVHLDTDRARRANWLAAAAVGRAWRDDFLVWSDNELANSRQQLLSTTFVDPAVRLGGMGFLKKALDKRFQLARMRVIREMDAGRIPPLDPVVIDEVRKSIREWKEPHSWRLDPNRKQEPLEL